ncbi:MAG: glycosyltransferase [Planctomycetes bacterium]|nr:glycosyltransferase [Planctomycetota bacterium]
MSGGNANLAVAVVLHESLGHLPTLLDGLLAQRRRPDRLVFCLNGADDGAGRYLRERCPEALLIERPDNPGFAGGMNACLAQLAGCDRVLMLNPDVVLEGDHLATLERVLDQEPRAAGVGGLLLAGPDREGRPRIDSSGFRVQPWLRIVDRGAGAADLDRYRERERVLGICAAAAMFRVAALLEVAEDGQILDEDFWMYKEDQDLCLRLGAAGWQLWFEPAARARHARGWAYGARSEVPLVLRRHSLKNRYLLLVKHWRWREQAWKLPLLLVFELALFLGLAIREPRCLAAYAMAWRLLPRAAAKRRALLRRAGPPMGSPRPIWQVSP